MDPVHDLRLELLRWAQGHKITRYSDGSVVSHNDGVEELLAVVQRRRLVDPQAELHTLSVVERMQVEAVAYELHMIGAYQGTDRDAITDAIAIVRSAMFAPPLGDNHHNANECPHCQRA